MSLVFRKNSALREKNASESYGFGFTLLDRDGLRA